jgi:hypothetical protein
MYIIITIIQEIKNLPLLFMRYQKEEEEEANRLLTTLPRIQKYNNGDLFKHASWKNKRTNNLSIFVPRCLLH